MAIKSTMDYSIFKFREDNRAKINQAHVKKLAESIKARDLLYMRPIQVNEEMEILDGQHRVLAAQSIPVKVYYEVKEDLTSKDIIIMNLSKCWSIPDYLNYYVKNGYPEYIKLNSFMLQNNISLKVALSLSVGRNWVEMGKFKSGDYKFVSDTVDDELQICWDTINYIKKMNGYSSYTTSSRFWKALVKLINHSMFDPEKWMGNLERLIEKVGPRARCEDYLALFTEIHNWRNSFKVNLLEE